MKITICILGIMIWCFLCFIGSNIINGKNITNGKEFRISKVTTIIVAIAGAVAIIATAVLCNKEVQPAEKRPIDAIDNELTENDTYANFASDVKSTINYIMTSEKITAERAAEQSLVDCVQAIRESCGRLESTNVTLAFLDSDLCMKTPSCLVAQFAVGSGRICEVRIRISSKTTDNGLMDIYAGSTEVNYR